jgi:predicted glycosyltransferase
VKILVYLHHPSQFHVFKNCITELKKSFEILIIATHKDILTNLLDEQGFEYINILPEGRKGNKFSIALSLLKQDYRLLKICLTHKPKLLIGTSTEITHVGRLLGIKSYFFIEDDISVVPLVGLLAHPFATKIVSPEVCNNGRWNNKTIKYRGYQKLAYLHPNVFTPDYSVASRYLPSKRPYCIIRLSSLDAHHDTSASGISNEFISQIINILKPIYNVFITTERRLSEEFSEYQLSINPLDIHHLLAFASIFIGDSQSMAVEAAMLGTPNIRISSFSGKISVLEELEHQYQLTFGIHPKEESTILETIEQLISDNLLQQKFQTRRQKMLSEKIDVTAWLIELFSKETKKQF